MRRHATRVVLGSAALLLAVGCNSGEQLKRVEQELSELKIEVFKLRREAEDANAKAETERNMCGLRKASTSAPWPPIEWPKMPVRCASMASSCSSSARSSRM